MVHTIIYDTTTRAILVVDPLLNEQGQPILPVGVTCSTAVIGVAEAAKFSTPNSQFSLGADGVTVVVTPAPAAPPDPVAVQRATDAAESLNSPAVRDTQARRDSFARLIGVNPLAIPITQDATASDISLLGAA